MQRVRYAVIQQCYTTTVKIKKITIILIIFLYKYATFTYLIEMFWELKSVCEQDNGECTECEPVREQDSREYS